MQKHHLLTLVLGVVLIGAGVWTLNQRSHSKPLDTAPSYSTSGTLLSTPSIAQPKKILVSSPSTDQESAKKLEILTEIFNSKNDNDPRLDQEFKQLTPNTKVALEKEYDRLNVESRNERGTIVFLLGRNLSTPEDFKFLQKVVEEPPCLSLSNCDRASHGDDPDTLSEVQTTLQYPQIVALKALESFLAKNPDSAMAKDLIRKASQSKHFLVSQMASSMISDHATDRH